MQISRPTEFNSVQAVEQICLLTNTLLRHQCRPDLENWTKPFPTVKVWSIKPPICCPLAICPLPSFLPLSSATSPTHICNLREYCLQRGPGAERSGGKRDKEGTYHLSRTCSPLAHLISTRLPSPFKRWEVVSANKWGSLPRLYGQGKKNPDSQTSRHLWLFQISGIYFRKNSWHLTIYYASYGQMKQGNP